MKVYEIKMMAYFQSSKRGMYKLEIQCPIFFSDKFWLYTF